MPDAIPTPIAKPEIKYTQLFINNEFVNSTSGRQFATINPATQDEIAHVQEGDAVDIDKAVRAAAAAFDRDSAWRQVDVSARRDQLYQLADLILRDATYLASLESYNSGKPFVDAHGDVMAAVTSVKNYANAADRLNSRVLAADRDKSAHIVYERFGVCGAITTWNYPILMAVINLAACLVMGCPVVLKPAEQTPLTALALAALVKEAGFPAGLFNVVPGFGPTTGRPLVRHPIVKKINFFGSAAVGKLIQCEAAGSTKLVVIELGGRLPFIVLHDVDVEYVVGVTQRLVMINRGECRIAATKTFVHESIYDEFVKRSVELAKKRKVGNPLDLNNEQGPQIDKKQFDKILELVEAGKSEGAKLECGGKRIGDKGFFIEPTVFSNVTDDMRIAREETFGPVQLILKYKDTDELVERVNAINFEFAAKVFHGNRELASNVLSRLTAGQVYINNFYDASNRIPLGPFKVRSGVQIKYGPLASVLRDKWPVDTPK